MKPVTSAPAPVSRVRVFLALLRRDARVMRRELPSFLIRTTLQPLLFTIVFGFLLPSMGLVQGFYVSALLPGILAISVSLACLQAVALPMVVEFGLGGEIEDRLLAPVPIELIAHEKVVVGIMQGIVTALFVFPLTRLIMGPVPGLTLANAGTAVGVLVLGAAAFSALGLVLGTAISPQRVSLLFSAIIFPPQLTIISLFQVLVEYGLFNTRLGVSLVYMAIQLPLTFYLLEGFFAQIPQDYFDAAKIDGCSELGVFWRLTLPIGMPAIATTIILNLIELWNEFLYAVVLVTDDDKRTLPLGIMRFLGDKLEDIGMIATGMMIAILPVILVYAFLSERLIRGMTASVLK